MQWTKAVLSSLWLVATVGISACNDGAASTAPSPSQQSPTASPSAQVSGATASSRWNELARNLSQKYGPPQQVGLRGLAYLSLAQYNAVVTAESDAAHPSARGAATGASVAVLSWIYPAEATYLESLVGQPDAGAAEFAAGVLIGRGIGAQVIASAANDNFNLVWTGTVPVGPGFWFSLALPPAPPIAPRLGEMRPFFLSSGSQFRPPPPPAFGSSAFLSALALVRHYSDNRTLEQDQIAKFWALPGGFKLIPAYHNFVATDLIARHHLSERDAAHTLALANQAAMDGFIACHDAKYTYWLLRPTMADPLITLSVPLPNHPSYPSNHACVTGTFMAVLGTLFPSEAPHLKRLADQAALSRTFGGLHYLFDGQTGLAIGRQIAPWALAHDVGPGQLFPIK